MNGFKATALLAFAIVVLGPRAAFAQAAEHQLGSTVQIGFTILPQAVIGVRSTLRGTPELSLRGNMAAPLTDFVSGYLLRDSRGERPEQTMSGLRTAVADAVRAGEHEIDVTIIF